MLKSMTAFARQDCDTRAGTLTWEIRSVNHRYLEPSFRLPDSFREVEPALRERLRKHLARGKLDCTLKWQASGADNTNIHINDAALKALRAAGEQVKSAFTEVAPIDVFSVLSWPGIIEQDTTDKKVLLSSCIDSFEQAIKTLNENRSREGQQLAPLFDTRLNTISATVADVRQMMPSILARQSENIRTRFEDARIELDTARLEQEMVMLAQKSDVAEELDRLDAHVTEVRNVLMKNEPVGRRLDFLMQELNREANTLSSKSIVTDTTQAAVELKVLIEQMREQVQNIE
jgi:uncharacterized protein (TIGR00255 family)